MSAATPEARRAAFAAVRDQLLIRDAERLHRMLSGRRFDEIGRAHV